ncbi:MAG: NrfD/PsrC family molybdoenzyme membrane anchor subunit [Halodesulfurarchaeum sp.]|nr:NrfD/PsrC family molybdoenzyme membrane anchor subunit [Halodesulfurarchaeum sp.]
MSTQTPAEMEKFLVLLDRPSGRFLGAMLLAAIVAIAGIAVWLMEVSGAHLSNLGNWGTAGQVPWGLDIGVFDWWTGMAIGALVLSGLIRILRADGYLGFARIAEFLAPLGFLGGFLHILFDMGRPARVLNTVIHVQVQSPLFWDIVLIGGLVVLSLVYLFATVRQDLGHLVADGVLEDSGLHGLLAGSGSKTDGGRIVWWLAAIILAFIPVVGGGLVPWVWSQIGMSMNWFGAVQGPTFLLMSLATGFTAVLFVGSVLRAIYGWSDVFSNQRLMLLGGVTAGVGFFYLVATLFEIQSGSFAPVMAPPDIGTLLVPHGAGTILLLAVVAIAIPAIVLGMQIVLQSFNNTTTLVATLILLLGVLSMEAILVVVGLSHSELLYPVGEYVPSLAEWVRVAGTISLVAFGFMVLSALLPLIPIRTDMAAESDSN